VQLAIDAVSAANPNPTPFPADEEVVIYAAGSPYVEAVNIPAMVPDRNARLIIRANTGDSVTIDNAGAGIVDVIDINAVDNVTVKDLTLISRSTGKRCIGGNGKGWEIRNCPMTVEAGQPPGWIDSLNQGLLINVTMAGTAAKAINALSDSCVIGCKIPAVIECSEKLSAFVSCVFTDSGYILAESPSPTAPLTICHFPILNCVFYNTTYAIRGTDGYSVKVQNTIFSGVGDVFSSQLGGNGLYYFQNDYNCFDGNTSIASINGGSITTLAGMQSFTDSNGDSGDANSIDDDPLFTTPGSDDFTLQATSPCKHTGAGAGVLMDVEGIAFDMRQPDMGANSTGAYVPPTPPVSTSLPNFRDY